MMDGHVWDGIVADIVRMGIKNTVVEGGLIVEARIKDVSAQGSCIESRGFYATVVTKQL